MNFKLVFYFLFGLFNISETFNLLNNTHKILAANLIAVSNIINPIIPYGVHNPQVDYVYAKEKTNDVENSNHIHMGEIYVEKNSIYFYSQVDHESAKVLNLKLKEMIEESKIVGAMYKENVNPIHLHIQSYGGSLLDTFSVVDTIEKSEVPIYTYVDGYAASAATLISVSGAKRFIGPNSIVLIHQLSTSSGGKYEEMIDDKKNMDTFMKIIRNIYLGKSRLDVERLNDILRHDWWLTANESLEYGLVDEII
tara:strand:- start:149 stop:904 length:756 start_codon:yes stop_codon:yes gene_type:complete